ncbi:hypothetical protein VR7878_03065 [Vibrio ruber DSM 16370]|uniref:Uncharacterized protein n=1 Tax=Vibrio ruber (strain DSM 16370 / JCM 11486 / BCRC 17186 / CECT 7878 / LMG 23124 / VR1) TaxID=1123498 RepID=A0A1R4LQP1_VIBR1|nr:hypothetical protein VR7878_03065 [Vibrio ruber DSM 16370]
MGLVLRINEFVRVYAGYPMMYFQHVGMIRMSEKTETEYKCYSMILNRW